MPPPKTYVVEHLDPELGSWSALEYTTIAKECAESGAKFCITSVSENLIIPQVIQDLQSTIVVETRAIEELYENKKDRICLLDPAALTELSPDDESQFDVFLFGGILGDDPPRDRTSELRDKGFNSRRLGPIQMTTDTAVRVTRTVIQQKVPLTEIKYVDNPEIRINKHESTEMPFRYMVDDNLMPIMPQGMIELIQKDSEKGIGDLF